MAGKYFYKRYPGLSKSGLYFLDTNPTMNDYQAFDNQELRDEMLSDEKQPSAVVPDNVMTLTFNSKPATSMDYGDKYKMTVKPPKENIGVNSSQQGYSMPYNATFLNNMPYTKEEYMASFRHGMNANDDATSNKRYQDLLERREKIVAKIQELTVNIAYQEKLRAIEMKNDPMWDIAKQQYILKGDTSGLEHIMSRMEAEKGRKATEDLALLNKSDEEVKKIDAYKKTFRTKLAFANNAFREKENENNAENRRAAFNNYVELLEAADDLKMSEADLAKFVSPDYTEWFKEYSKSGESGKSGEGSADDNGGSPSNKSEVSMRVEDLIKDHKYDIAEKLLKDNVSLFGDNTTSEYTTLMSKIDIARKDYNKGAVLRDLKKYASNILLTNNDQDNAEDLIKTAAKQKGYTALVKWDDDPAKRSVDFKKR